MYIDLVPNKTIYVSDDDLPTLERAQQVSGGNLSGAIMAALRAYVKAADYREAGYDEVLLRDGPDGLSRKRFFGRLLVSDIEYDDVTGNATEWTLYEGRTGKLVLGTHHVDWEKFPTRRQRQQTGNWFKDLTGITSMRSLFTAELPDWGDYSVTVADSVDELKTSLPEGLYRRAEAALRPVIDDLDV